MPFAGEGEFFSPDSVLSHCKGALLPMFGTKEAALLRLLCREFKEAVAEIPWEDNRRVILGSVAGWRACFPIARTANVSVYDHYNKSGRRTQVTDADFVHFVGLKRLNMSRCMRITDAGFVHLKGIHTLDMIDCHQPTITDAAFTHLKGIHTLNMWGCYQSTITNAAFSHLKGVHTLHMSLCTQPTITDAAFSHLKGIHTLDMSYCTQPTITDAAFSHLKGIKYFSMHHCTQPTITRAAFEHLKGVRLGDLSGCTLAMIAGAEEAGVISKERAERDKRGASDYVPPVVLGVLNNDY